MRDLELGEQVALGLGQLGGLPQRACRAGEGAEGGESMTIVRPSSVVPLALTRVNGANAVARAQAVVSGIAARRCLAEPEVFVSIGTAVAGGGIFAVSPSSGPLDTRLTEDIPAQKIQAPVLLAQGEADPLVTPAAQAAYVKTECATGTTLDYRTCPGLDHLSLVAATSPLISELISWTQDRFDGKPAPSTC